MYKICLILCLISSSVFAGEFTYKLNNGTDILLSYNSFYDLSRNGRPLVETLDELDAITREEIFQVELLFKLTGTLAYYFNKLPLSGAYSDFPVTSVAHQFAEYIYKSHAILRGLDPQNQETVARFIFDFLKQNVVLIDTPLIQASNTGYLAAIKNVRVNHQERKLFWGALKSDLKFIDPHIFDSRDTLRLIRFLEKMYDTDGLFFEGPEKCTLVLSLREPSVTQKRFQLSNIFRRRSL